MEIFSKRSYFDFDILIFGIEQIRQKMEQGAAPDVSLRQKEILGMLELRRTIIVLTYPFQMSWLFPMSSAVDFEESVGQAIEMRGGPDNLKVFWNSISDFMVYTTRWKEAGLGTPFLFVKDVNSVVGSIIRYKGGHILFLPTLNFAPKTRGREGAEGCFLDAVNNLAISLSPKSVRTELPKWSLNFTWEKLEALARDWGMRHRQLEEIAKAEANSESLHAKENDLKILIAGTGNTLEERVIEAVREIGFNAEKGEPGRDDLILEWNGRFAVVEIKGKKKSAGEDDAAQLEKWVSGFYLEKGIAAKGLLVVNAFCETPLEKRDQSAAFPHQMLDYSVQRGHCLMTTTQLLGILLKVRQNPEERSALIEGIFNAVGLYPDFSDYKTFLKLRDESEPKS
jgi:hypothetical protein